MAVTLQCSRCMHEQKVDDDKAEAGVPCKICHNLIKPPTKTKSKLAGEKNAKAQKAEKEEGIKTGPPSTAKANTQTAPTTKKPPPPKDDDEDDDYRPKSKSSKKPPKSRDDDEERPSPRKRRDKEEESSSSLMYVLVGGGVLVVLFLLCAGGGAAAYFAMGSDPQPAPIAVINPPVINPPPVNMFPNPNPVPPVNPFPNPVPPPINPPFPNPPFPNPNPLPPPNNPFQPREDLDPNDPTKIERVVTILKGAPQDRGPAYTWLKGANPEHPRRNEVATIVEGHVNDYIANPSTFGNDGMFDAFFRWATKNNVPAIVNVVDKSRFTVWDNRYRQEAMKLLGKLKDPRGAEPLVGKLGNVFDGETANNALTEMGSVAESAVVKQFNARDGRDQARNLLKVYNTKQDVILTQCIADVASPDNDRRGGAMQWLANTPVDSKRRPEVAKAINNAIPKANFFFDKDLIKVLETWGTAENAPALIQKVDNGPFGDKEAVRILGKLKDQNGNKAVARALGNFHMQEAAKAALRDIGPQAEGYVVEAMFASKDRRGYISYLGENGTIKIGGVALQQLMVQNQQDRLLQIQAQQAVKTIFARGK